jgi:quercetin dioxygenase-like cupin family protein
MRAAVIVTFRDDEAAANPPLGLLLGDLASAPSVRRVSLAPLSGRHTSGPYGAAPPLHSHPQDETFFILEGEITRWIVEPAMLDDDGNPPRWVRTCGRCCGVGGVVFSPGGTPHTFRAESDTVRMLVVSTPAGIDDMVRGLAEPARWPWLQPPPDRPRIPAQRMASVERETGMVRHGPPPARV